MYKNDNLQKFFKDSSREADTDRIRGCLFGGAVGDALGYAVEFLDEEAISEQYGKDGIREYQISEKCGKALISDDTQMSLFTADGLLVADTKGKVAGIQVWPKSYVAMAYQDWLRTQEMSYEDFRKAMDSGEKKFHCVSWLSDVPELYSRRSPGNTCLSALNARKRDDFFAEDYTKATVNNSKGCGAVMRVAPLALVYHQMNMRRLDSESAQIAAITHGHSLGYMPASVLTHIINRIVFPKEELTLEEMIIEARNKAVEIFEGDEHIKELTDLIDLAMELAKNDAPDLENIHQLGEGWVAEETLAIAIYCALKYRDDFSKGVITAVNHNGDSDSTGAITGNIIGAIVGFENIEEKWKKNLELSDVILELADDLCTWATMDEQNKCDDPNWLKKYMR